MKIFVDRGNHHRNIVCGIVWLDRDRFKFISPVTIAVDNKADVPMQPERERNKSVHQLNCTGGKRQDTHHSMQNTISQVNIVKSQLAIRQCKPVTRLGHYHRFDLVNGALLIERID